MTEATRDSLGRRPPSEIQQLATPLSTRVPPQRPTTSSGTRTMVEIPPGKFCSPKQLNPVGHSPPLEEIGRLESELEGCPAAERHAGAASL